MARYRDLGAVAGVCAVPTPAGPTDDDQVRRSALAIMDLAAGMLAATPYRPRAPWPPDTLSPPAMLLRASVAAHLGCAPAAVDMAVVRAVLRAIRWPTREQLARLAALQEEDELLTVPCGPAATYTEMVDALSRACTFQADSDQG